MSREGTGINHLSRAVFATSDPVSRALPNSGTCDDFSPDLIPRFQ
jgi:hypothetical protein